MTTRGCLVPSQTVWIDAYGGGAWLHCCSMQIMCCYSKEIMAVEAHGKAPFGEWRTTNENDVQMVIFFHIYVTYNVWVYWGITCHVWQSCGGLASFAPTRWTRRGVYGCLRLASPAKTWMGNHMKSPSWIGKLTNYKWPGWWWDLSSNLKN